MAVLQIVPDLPHSGAAGADAPTQPNGAQSSAVHSPARIFSPVITAPRVHPAVLMPFLRFGAELVVRATGATGCAIAMRAGAGFRCYASVGDAPPVDAPVRLAGSLTGVCVRKGKTVRCDDMIEQEASQMTGYAGLARSIVLAPIFQDGNIGGVVGIFAPEPHTFLDEHVTALEHIAGIFGIALLHPDRQENSSANLAALDGESGEPASTVHHAHSALSAGIPPAPTANDQAARALEGLARVLSNALLNQQRPALPAEAESPAGQPRKRLYGLPCAGCGAYSPSNEPQCIMCGTPRKRS